ncbi:hypothetical protein AB832_06320 [Flavobacteriaceae bacterium (ex Bugula neritina AB1)]|nr:hypothetical protein AB832_06320 [Flavobacteriaceae bacterium (ex Bugula neritina AB1)]
MKQSINNKINILPNYPIMEQFRDFVAPKEIPKYVKCIAGPIRSGKTYTTAQEVLVQIYKQPRNINGYRYSRWAFIKHELARAKEIFVQEWMTKFGKWSKYNSQKATILFIDRKNKVRAEIDLYGLNRRIDAEKYLKSKSYTHAWVNEAYLIDDEGVFDIVLGRIGCFPMKQQGCIYVDTNLPDVRHWIYKRFEKEREKFPNYYIFYQPSGLSAEAENREYASKADYEILALNYDEAKKKRDVDGKYSFVSSGQPVYPTFSRNKCVLDYGFYDKDKDFYFNYTRDYGYLFEECIVGCDGGLDCTSIYMARCLRTGTLLIFDEIYLDKSIEERSCDLMAKYMTTKEEQLRQKYGFEKFTYYLDPSCKNRVPTNAGSVLKLYRAYGFNAMSAGTNDPTKRREGIYKLLSKNLLKITRNCEWVINGMDGGYRYKDQNRYEETTTQVVKDEYSHVIEGLEYGVLGLRIFENENLGHSIRNLSKQNNNFMKSLSNLYKANQENEQKELKKIKYLSKHEEFVENLKNSFKTNDFY